MNIEMSKQPSGSKILLTRKSVASKIPSPNIDTSANKPKERAAGILAKKTTIPVIIATFLRVYFPFAVSAEIIISNKLNDDVMVANKNRSKNSVRNNEPKAIWLNTVGRTTNNNPGPSVGSSPKANTTGNIANPASKDTRIFNDTTLVAVDGIFSFLLRYELYVTIQEKPTAREKKDCPSA